MRRGRIGISALMWLATIFGLTSCVNRIPLPRDTERALREEFPDAAARPLSRVADKTHFVDTGFPEGEKGEESLVFLVHGSPGSWDSNLPYLKDPILRKRARIISVDRPGFGRSGLGSPEASLAEQSKRLGAVLTKVLGEGTDGGAPRRKAILVGHSYGGPLVARMAVDFPELVKGIVMVAPAIDPETQNALWFQRLGARKSLRWLVPRSLYSTCVELVPLREHLVVLEPHWKEIQAPTIVIQGGRDFLVPPTVADFAERQLVSAPKSIRRFPRKGHFLWWTRPEVVRKAILDLLDGKEFEI